MGAQPVRSGAGCEKWSLVGKEWQTGKVLGAHRAGHHSASSTCRSTAA